MELSYIVGKLDKVNHQVIGEDGFVWEVSSHSWELIEGEHPFKDGDIVQIFNVNEYSVETLFNPPLFCVVKCPCCKNF